MNNPRRKSRYGMRKFDRNDLLGIESQSGIVFDDYK